MEERRNYQHKLMSQEEGRDCLIARAYKVMQEDEGLIGYIARSNEALATYVKDSITDGLLTSQSMDVGRFLHDKDYRVFLYRRKLIDGLRSNATGNGIVDFADVQQSISDNNESSEEIIMGKNKLANLYSDIEGQRVLSDNKKKQLKAIITGTLEGKNKKMIAKELSVDSAIVSQVLALAKRNMPKYAHVWESLVGRHQIPVMDQKSNIIVRDLDTIRLLREDLSQKDSLTGEEKILFALVRWYTDDTFTREERDAIFLEQGITKMTQKKLKFYLSKLEKLAGRSLSFSNISKLANKK